MIGSASDRMNRGTKADVAARPAEFVRFSERQTCGWPRRPALKTETEGDPAKAHQVNGNSY
jgi:hypothetical protein